jgi:orotidine-5'-phosphate decarboxylase
MSGISPSRIIYAADIEDLELALQSIREMAYGIGAVKIGPAWAIAGKVARFIEEARALNLKVFLDLKLHDIPNTVHAAIKAAAALGVNMITLHIEGGHAMMQEAVRAKVGADIVLLGVTRLTSQRASVEEVVALAQQAHDAWLDGVVCSAWELAAIKSKVNMITVVPGIRHAQGPHHEQQRVATPRQAIDSGADYIVLGRMLLEQPDAASRRVALDAVLAS